MIAAAVPGSDVYLTLTPRVDGSEGFVLEAYEERPTGAVSPHVAARVPMPPAGRIMLALNRLLAGNAQALQQLGDTLATWLFTTTPDSPAVPSRPASRPADNPVGAYLRNLAAHLSEAIRKHDLAKKQIY